MPNGDRFQKVLHGQRVGGWRISGALLRMASAIAALAAILAGVPARAQTEDVIHNFRAGQDGDEPLFGLAAHQGHLYGTTFHGGTAGIGQVFQLTPWPGHILWQKELLHSFLGSAGDDGGPPWGRVIADKAGNLYGTTVNNGPACCGVVYKVSPPAEGETNWTESIIYSFTGGSDGNWPYGGLALDSTGALYGATQLGGGACGCGTIFKLSRPQSGTTWPITVLHTFAGGDDGSTPNGDLLIDKTNGSVFGTTVSGGVWGLGIVYQLTPPSGGQTEWTMNYVHGFEGDATDANDGATPNGGLVGGTGDLWGTTQSGGASINCCGMVFELRQEIAGSPLYTLINHHNFTGGQDGATPYAGLYENASHAYWGTTQFGGVGSGGADFGTIFKLSLNALRQEWSYSVVYSFSGGPSDGAYPESPLIENQAGVFFGTTSFGGTLAHGTIFKFIP